MPGKPGMQGLPGMKGDMGPVGPTGMKGDKGSQVKDTNRLNNFTRNELPIVCVLSGFSGNERRSGRGGHSRTEGRHGNPWKGYRFVPYQFVRLIVIN